MKKTHEISNVGKRIRELLKKHGKKQAWLANEIGIEENHLSMIIHGKRNLTFEKAKLIASLFPGTRVEWLMCQDDEETVGDHVHLVLKKHLQKVHAIEQLIESTGFSVGSEYTDVHVDADGTTHKSNPKIVITSPEGATRYLEPDEYEHFKLSIKRFVKGQLLVMFQYSSTDGEEVYGRW